MDGEDVHLSPQEEAQIAKDVVYSWLKDFDPSLAEHSLVNVDEHLLANGEGSLSASGIVPDDINGPVGDLLEWLSSTDLTSDRRFASMETVLDLAEDTFSNDLDVLAPFSTRRPPVPLSGDTCAGEDVVTDASPRACAQKPRSRRPKLARPSAKTTTGYGSHRSFDLSPEGQDDQGDQEEKEWETRQQRNGIVGRLVIYPPTDNPQEDLKLRGGAGRHIVVAAVKDNGRAAMAGVRVGDRLVSIDGKKDCLRLPAGIVHQSLQTMTKLVFVGFVGKLHAEVRISCSNDMCGLGSRHDVIKDPKNRPCQLAEEKVFLPGLASLFLAVHKPGQDLDVETLSDEAPSMFELQHREAMALVSRALRRLPRRSGDNLAVKASLEALPRPACQMVADPPSPRPWPAQFDDDCPNGNSETV